MIITLISPRRGMGQTVTSINLSALISSITGNKTLLIDMNDKNGDISAYLSDSSITKGIDDFVNMYITGVLTKDKLKMCVKKVTSNLDIMASNTCYNIDEMLISSLIDNYSLCYPNIIIDLNLSDNSLEEKLKERSDVIIAVLNQTKTAVLSMAENIQMYVPFMDKLLVVINRTLPGCYARKTSYSISCIKKDIESLGFGKHIYELEYNFNLFNECNRNHTLNFIMEGLEKQYLYVRQLKAIASGINNISRLDNFKIQKERHIFFPGKLIHGLVSKR